MDRSIINRKNPISVKGMGLSHGVQNNDSIFGVFLDRMAGRFCSHLFVKMKKAKKSVWISSFWVTAPHLHNSILISLLMRFPNRSSRDFFV